MKQQVTKAEYLQLVGLLKLAEHHNEHLDEIRNATRALLASTEEEDRGHVDDAVFADADADTLLKRLAITVADD